MDNEFDLFSKGLFSAAWKLSTNYLTDKEIQIKRSVFFLSCVTSTNPITHDISHSTARLKSRNNKNVINNQNTPSAYKMFFFDRQPYEFRSTIKTKKTKWLYWRIFSSPIYLIINDIFQSHVYSKMS